MGYGAPDAEMLDDAEDAAEFIGPTPASAILDMIAEYEKQRQRRPGGDDTGDKGKQTLVRSRA